MLLTYMDKCFDRFNFSCFFFSFIFIVCREKRDTALERKVVSSCVCVCVEVKESWNVFLRLWRWLLMHFCVMNDFRNILGLILAIILLNHSKGEECGRFRNSMFNSSDQRAFIKSNIVQYSVLIRIAREFRRVRRNISYRCLK